MRHVTIPILMVLLGGTCQVSLADSDYDAALARLGRLVQRIKDEVPAVPESQMTEEQRSRIRAEEEREASLDWALKTLARLGSRSRSHSKLSTQWTKSTLDLSVTVSLPSNRDRWLTASIDVTDQEDSREKRTTDGGTRFYTDYETTRTTEFSIKDVQSVGLYKRRDDEYWYVSLDLKDDVEVSVERRRRSNELAYYREKDRWVTTTKTRKESDVRIYVAPENAYDDGRKYRDDEGPTIWQVYRAWTLLVDLL